MPSKGKQSLLSPRLLRLKKAVQEFKPGICTERALIWTRYFKDSKNKNKPACIRIAEAFQNVLLEKTVRIYPDELIVGNFTSKRVGGEILPELLGVPVMEDIFKFSRRKTSPLQISAKETLQLLSILPFWMFRFLAMRAYSSPVAKIRNMISQLRSTFYVINETGGIAHTIPDHEKLLRVGTGGIIAEVEKNQAQVEKDSEKWQFHEAVKISAHAFGKFCQRYETLARRMAATETDTAVKQNLEAIGNGLGHAAENGAKTFRQALQITYLIHIAIMIESLDNSIGLGRMDQYLYAYYKKDIAEREPDKRGGKGSGGGFFHQALRTGAGLSPAGDQFPRGILQCPGRDCGRRG